MHEFNTFDNENFRYPNLCSRCAKNEPSGSWTLVHTTIEFPEGFTGGHDKRAYNDYICRVPICSACQAELKRQSRICWGIGGVIGAASGLLLMQYMLTVPTIKPIGCYLASGGLAALVTFFVGYVLKCIVASMSFASYDGLKRTLKFKNREFQAAFDRSNLTLNGSTEPSW